MKYLLLVSVLFLISSCSINTSNNIEGNVVTEQNQSISEKEDVIVTDVTDGDTFKIQNGQKVRLIGINAPEKNEKYYQESTKYLESLVLNKEVTMEKDVSDTDRFGRLLRYVYLEDGTFVNLEMVKFGYAKAKSYKPDIKYDHILREASSPSNECISLGCDENTKVIGNKNSLVYHYCYCTFASRIKKENLVCFNSEEEAENLGYKETNVC